MVSPCSRKVTHVVMYAQYCTDSLTVYEVAQAKHDPQRLAIPHAIATDHMTNSGAAKDWLKGGSQGKFGPEGGTAGGGPKKGERGI